MNMIGRRIGTEQISGLKTYRIQPLRFFRAARCIDVGQHVGPVTRGNGARLVTHISRQPDMRRRLQIIW